MNAHLVRCRCFSKWYEWSASVSRNWHVQRWKALQHMRKRPESESACNVRLRRTSGPRSCETMAATDLLRRNADPSEDEVRHALEGNLCRCTGYHNIVKAVLDAA